MFERTEQTQTVINTNQNSQSIDFDLQDRNVQTEDVSIQGDIKLTDE